MMINLPIRGPHLVWVLQHLWVCLPVLPSTAGIYVFAATSFGFQWKFQVPRWFFCSPYSVMFSLTQLSLFLGHSTLRCRCIWQQKLSPKNRNGISINKIHCSVSAIKQAEKLNNIQNRKRIFLPLTHCGRPELWYCSYVSLIFNCFHSGSADSPVNTRCEGRWAQGISTPPFWLISSKWNKQRTRIMELHWNVSDFEMDGVKRLESLGLGAIFTKKCAGED